MDLAGQALIDVKTEAINEFMKSYENRLLLENHVHQGRSEKEASSIYYKIGFASLREHLMSRTVAQIQEMSHMPLSVKGKPLVLRAAQAFGIQRADGCRASELKELSRFAAWRSFKPSEDDPASYTGALMSHLKMTEPESEPETYKIFEQYQYFPHVKAAVNALITLETFGDPNDGECGLLMLIN